MLLHVRRFREKRNEKSRYCLIGINEINLHMCRESAWRFDRKERHLEFCALRQSAVSVAMTGVRRGKTRCCVSVWVALCKSLAIWRLGHLLMSQGCTRGFLNVRGGVGGSVRLPKDIPSITKFPVTFPVWIIHYFTPFRQHLCDVPWAVLAGGLVHGELLAAI